MSVRRFPVCCGRYGVGVRDIIGPGRFRRLLAPAFVGSPPSPRGRERSAGRFSERPGRPQTARFLYENIKTTEK